MVKLSRGLIESLFFIGTWTFCLYAQSFRWRRYSTAVCKHQHHVGNVSTAWQSEDTHREVNLFIYLYDEYDNTARVDRHSEYSRLQINTRVIYSHYGLWGGSQRFFRYVYYGMVHYDLHHAQACEEYMGKAREILELALASFAATKAKKGDNQSATEEELKSVSMPLLRYFSLRISFDRYELQPYRPPPPRPYQSTKP
ncbi:uncharacterized protein BYT42DRAFT_541667 [Radiomyces spectabilis]|uniref:uncharacterized protein n=1 Tax=Radiomyces spectabilis TaxID=64574 RepID=UPI00222008A3|nr:uncharacterized protein BYT42DRAFT_541667 [Radiomyces spectabilis]KAI8393390.1 hypothetical protein BYT42DRAFT_541667 [Radiomyces spectabilis]